MIWVFLRIYLILLLPVLLLLMLQWNPLSWFTSRWAEEQVRMQTIGTFRLIQQELATRPEDRWRSAITEMARHFPHHLALRAIDELNLSSNARDRLSRLGLIMQGRPEPHAIYRLGDTGKALSLALQTSDAEHIAARVLGVRYLVSQRLEHADDPQRVISDIGKLYPFPLRLTPGDKIDLPHTLRETLYRLGAARQELDGNTMLLHILSKSGKYLITAGPIPVDAVRKRYPYLLIGLPAALVAFGLLLWTLTLWRELRHLKAVVKAFSDGALDRRARLSGYSTLHSLSQAYNRMAGHIQQLMRSQQDLIDAVSHELKTPIARMRFSLEMLAETRIATEHKRFEDQLANNLNELESLVGELLDLARIRRDADRRSEERITLPAWLDEQLHEFRNYHPEPALEQRVPEEPQAITVIDPRLLRRALFNLLDNAARHARSRILVALEMNDGQMCLSIEDDGPGIPADKQRHLFEPFVRLDDSRHRDTGGHGLGLAIVASIMRRYHGSTHHERSRLGGARFVICWPSVEQDAPVSELGQTRC